MRRLGMFEEEDTGWRPPASFPDLSSAKTIAIDVETRDPSLKDKGPGTHRGDGYVVGLAVGTDDGFRGYFPVRHELGGNMDPGMVFRWAGKQLGRENQDKIGYNLLYDLEWLAHEGVEVKGRMYDPSYAEPLLDAFRQSYALDAVAKTHLGEGKDDANLYRYLSAAFGGPATRTAQARNIWRAPVALVGLYGEGDVDLPLRLLEAQRRQLRAQDLETVFDLECSLIPSLLAMRQRGVRVDTAKAELVNADMQRRVKAGLARLKSLCGMDVDMWAADNISRALDRLGVKYPMTNGKKPVPSITAGWLDKQEHEFCQVLQDCRKWDKFRGTFIESYILNSHVRGRIYGTFHPLRSDDGGALTGRFSSSKPNLENIPARDEELGPLCRSIFLPEEGEEWLSADYSQIEYRLICHYGTGPSAIAARKRYNDDLTTDFHDMVAHMTGLPRKRAKSINFGKGYGSGVAKLAQTMGCTEEEAAEFVRQYDEEVPFVADLLKSTGNVAAARGYVRTILGRRARFPWFEKSFGGHGNLLLEEEAKKTWGEGKCRRAKTYRALNYIIQGSAADMFKTAMRNIWKSGVCGVIPMLNLVHDEFCFSKPPTKEADEAAREMVQMMITAIPLKVPILVDAEVGPNWGEVEAWT